MSHQPAADPLPISLLMETETMALQTRLIIFVHRVATGSRKVRNLFTPLFIALNYWELKWIEEPELEKRLGGAYLEYRAKTPMFLPDLKRIVKKERS